MTDFTYPYTFNDGPGNTASGVQVSANFATARAQILGLQHDAAAQGYSIGVIEDRPAASLATAGRRYYESTNEVGGHRLYLDIGTAWLRVALGSTLGKTAGSQGGSTGGDGSYSAGFAHGLGATPSWVGVTTGQLQVRSPAVGWDGTNISVSGNTGVGFGGWSIYWVALA